MPARSKPMWIFTSLSDWLDEESELLSHVGAVGLQSDPPQGNAGRLGAGLERDRHLVAQFGGFFLGLRLHRGWFHLAPDVANGGMDLLLEAGDQLAVGADQRLFSFDLGDDGLLGGEGWQGKLQPLQCFD
jgi:hypothetical protein